MTTLAKYRIAAVQADLVGIVDLAAGSMSVTNDAEAVVAELAASGLLVDDRRLIYCDTDGQWDELVHKAGRFVGFKHLGGQSLEQAIQLVRLRGGGLTT